MLFSYDFTNLGSAADVVSKLQARLRMAVETKREAESKLQGLGDAGEIEKYKIKAHILLLGEELDYVFEAIKLAQDKADGQAGQKSALLLHASSSESQCSAPVFPTSDYLGCRRRRRRRAQRSDSVRFVRARALW